MEFVAGDLLEGVFEETLAEIGGRSHRKWAVALVALILGATIAIIVMRRNARQSAASGGAGGLSLVADPAVGSSVSS